MTQFNDEANCDEEAVGQFIHTLMRPTFVFNMANGCMTNPSAPIRREKAAKEIHEAVIDYALQHTFLKDAST